MHFDFFWLLRRKQKIFVGNVLKIFVGNILIFFSSVTAKKSL